MIVGQKKRLRFPEPEETVLKELAEILPSRLYVVGGAVRESLVDYVRATDIDLACALTPEELTTSLHGTDFIVKPTSPKLGTLKIIRDGVSFEYTTFRTDSYPDGGRHTPDEVRFTSSISEDALRRDFTVNALYYDPIDEEILDPTDRGLEDLEEGVLSTVRDPDDVLSEDGLRLLRLVRFSASLGLKIDSDTFSSAQNNARLILDVAPERIRTEMDKILVSDTVRGVTGAQYYALTLMYELGLLSIVLPEIVPCYDYQQNPKYHKYPLDEHIFKAVRYAPTGLRLVALLHDLGKPVAKAKYGAHARHGQESEKIAREWMARFCYPKKVIERTAKIIRYHMFDLRCEASEKTLRIFIQKNHDIIDDLIDFKVADARAKGDAVVPHSAIRLRRLYEKMKSEGVPFLVSDLEIDGNDLVEKNVPVEERGRILSAILERAAYDEKFRHREAQLRYVTDRYSF